MSFAQVKDIIDGAAAQKWVILIIHKIDVEGDPRASHRRCSNRR